MYQNDISPCLFLILMYTKTMKDIELPTSYETGAYYVGERVLCLNPETDLDDDAILTLHKFYTVLAYEAESHIILVNDDEGFQSWLEADHFMPEGDLEFFDEDDD